MEVDEFGIRKIYPTNTNPNCAKPWLLGIGDWKTRKYGFDDYTTRSENGFLILNFKRYGGRHPGRGRNPVLAVPVQSDNWGTSSPVVTEKNQSKLRRRGYMGTSADWKNVEMTLYAKVNDVVADQQLKQIALLARGGPRHSNVFLFGDPCQGTEYCVKLRVAGTVSIAKELFHDEGGYAKKIIGTFIEGPVTNPLHPDDPRDHRATNWIGMKGIIYNKRNGNPKIEIWLDKNANNDWGTEPVLGFEDTGNWFIENDENQCNGDRDEKITWGGPAVIFRWDALSNIDIKFASVREIIPPVSVFHV